MGTILLIRHGESIANSEKRFTRNDHEPLTGNGREQAAAAGLHISRRFRPAALIASRFTRAQETAAIIASFVALEVESHDHIHERDFGCLKGQPYTRFDELATADPAYDASVPWHWTPPGGESRVQLQARVIPALRGIADAYPDDNVLVVCHGAVIQSVWAHVHGSWQNAPVPPNCGVVALGHEAGVFSAPVQVVF